MRKVTKKEIRENTITRKGEGFNPYYSFRVNIKGVEFYKEMGNPAIYVTEKGITTEIPLIDERKETFISEVQDYLLAMI